MQKSRRFLPHAANIEKWHYQTHLASRNELPKAFLSLTKGEGEKLDGGATVECVCVGGESRTSFYYSRKCGVSAD